MSGHVRIPVRVIEVAEITPLIKRFRFEPLDGSALPTFSPGAHITVEFEDGGVVRRNPYSLMSSPYDLSTYAISVRRDDAGRGGSRRLHEIMRPGMSLHVSGPTNLFPIEQSARKHLLIAGGIGITPFLAMCEQLLQEQAHFELHYAIRTQGMGAYVAELRHRLGRRITVHADDQNQSIPFQSLLRRQPLGTHLYVCGPGGMIDLLLGAAREIGWPESTLHSERFTAPASGMPYKIELAQSGKTVSVGPQQSMLEAIEAAGVDAPYLCRGGVCGECETRVIVCNGKLLHADHYLTEAEKTSGKTVMPCVSRFEGTRLVLDR